MFCANTILFGYLLGWLRLASGSVWPAAVGHAVWNAVVQGVFDKSTAGGQSWLWVGEQGLLLVAANAALVAVLGAGLRRSRRRQQTEAHATDGGMRGWVL